MVNCNANREKYRIKQDRKRKFLSSPILLRTKRRPYSLPKRKSAGKRQLKVAFAELRATLVNSGQKSPRCLRNEEQVILATIERIRDLENSIVNSILGPDAGESERQAVLQSVRGSFAASSSTSTNSMDCTVPSSSSSYSESPAKPQHTQSARRRLNFEEFLDDPVGGQADPSLLVMNEFLDSDKKTGSIFDGFEKTYSHLNESRAKNE